MYKTDKYDIIHRLRIQMRKEAEEMDINTLYGIIMAGFLTYLLIGFVIWILTVIAMSGYSQSRTAGLEVNHTILFRVHTL